MTALDIEAMARETLTCCCGVDQGSAVIIVNGHAKKLRTWHLHNCPAAFREAFAKAIQSVRSTAMEEEREACAKLCDERSGHVLHARVGANRILDEMRAMGSPDMRGQEDYEHWLDGEEAGYSRAASAIRSRTATERTPEGT